MMILLWIGGTKTLLFFILTSFLIVSTDGVFPTATTSAKCRDRWPSYCKIIRNSCITQRHWMEKYCPDTCELCKHSRKHVNPCQYRKCLYHSKCTIIGMHSAKCLCQNLFRCPKQHSFVCGTDRVTYRNDCALKAIACRLKKTIKVLSTGFCKYPCAHVKCQNFAKCQISSEGVGECKCPSYERCLNIPRPICGKDGVTYYNQCFWKVRSCKQNARTPIARRGRCSVTRQEVLLQSLRAAGEPRKQPCSSSFCPYYMICREINGFATCVKICPQSSCYCVHGARVEYYHHRNGCLMCRCKQVYLISARN